MRVEAYTFFKEEEEEGNHMQLPPSELSGVQERFFRRVE
jgi:hypothetical protein